MLELLESLGIPEGKGVTAIVGGGGKTTLMFRLANELASKGEIAAVTTTTKIFPPGEDGVFMLCEKDDFAALAAPGKVYCIGSPGPDGKLHFPGAEAFEAACRCAGRVFAEADGAKRQPVKAPDAHEPVIPGCADSVIAVAGLDALGGRIRDVCFRRELACAALNMSPEDILTPELLAGLIVSEKGQRKALPRDAAFSVVLNKADDGGRMEKARRTAELIRAALPGCRVAVAALAQRDCVRALYV